MKLCRKCDKVLPLSDFARDKNKHDGLNSWCRQCKVDARRKNRESIRDYVKEYKITKGCALCGYNLHSSALHLDHLEPDNKTKEKWSKNRAFNPEWPFDKLKQELSKCQVLCANCHAIKTSEQFNHKVIDNR